MENRLNISFIVYTAVLRHSEVLLKYSAHVFFTLQSKPFNHRLVSDHYGFIIYQLSGNFIHSYLFSCLCSL